MYRSKYLGLHYVKKHSATYKYPLILGAVEGKASFGYKYGIEKQPDGSVKNTAQIDIKYLTEMICDAAEEYYKTKSPSDFEEHTFELV